jgi:hypothetical protein
MLALGWGFIAWQNHFHVTPAMVFVCLAYLAAVTTIYTLWRTGATAVADDDEVDDSTWTKPAGALGELEREKRTLLKAIKEAEFDFQMGKLSKPDADEMIRVYRARAIEVIKDLDRLDHGTAGSAREQIMREVRARLEVEARSQKTAADARQVAAAKGAQGKGKAKGKQAREAAASASETAPAAEAAAAASASAADAATADSSAAASQPSAGGTGSGDSAPANGAVAPGSAAAAAAAAKAERKTALAAIDDEAMDADSTTTVESHDLARDPAAKEATR